MMENSTNYAVDVETISVGSMQVRVSGSGFPLILLHGFTTTSEFWREQVEEFSEPYQLIRPNLPGHGISGSPASHDYTIDAFVDDLEQIVDHFSLRQAALVGLSMGGIIAQRFAAKNPQLLKGLVLVDTTSYGIEKIRQPERVFAEIDRLVTKVTIEDIAAGSFGPNALRTLVEWAKREVSGTPECVARAAMRSLFQSDTRLLLPCITVPTLVIRGEYDAISSPEESRALCEGIPNNTFVEIMNAGHFPMLEQPHEFNRVVQAFLKQHVL